jgi:hypothetical protein
METQELKTSIHIKMLSGFYYLVSVCLLLTGLAYCFMPDILKSNFADNTIMLKMTTKEFVVYGGAMILLSLFEALLAYKLSKLLNWAKIIALAISALGFLWALLAIFIYGGLENFIFIILHSYFIWVLMTKYYGK